MKDLKRRMEFIFAQVSRSKMEWGSPLMLINVYNAHSLCDTTTFVPLIYLIRESCVGDFSDYNASLCIKAILRWQRGIICIA